MQSIINSNKYKSSNGLITSEWGPSAWDYLFSSIMGAYPHKIDINNYEHVQVQNEFKNLFSSLRYTLPCPTCQESYRIYWKEIPIDNYLNNRITLMHWLYLIKDKVNKKLICQEEELFKIEKLKIKKIYTTKDSKGQVKNITKDKYDKIIKKLKDDICITKKSVPFTNVLNYYESKRS